ncbi:MAG TPA: di-heme oxidoredictase family protein [Acidobacteriota bacterium]|jgi:CxxC motif-containing protein (DUF1111 family)
MSSKSAQDRDDRDLARPGGIRSRSELTALKMLILVFVAISVLLPVTVHTQSFKEAPAGFDGRSNGFVSLPQFKRDQGIFEQREEVEDGLGPVYNAQSCAECHQSPQTGGSSQVTELRAGHYNRETFIEHPGGSLIHDRAINPSVQERLMAGYEVLAVRASVSTLGDGFVECIDDSLLIAISKIQPPNMRGQVIQVPVLEADGALRVGRFGWKNQHASLLSFSADAYLNEMGITSELKPEENGPLGQLVGLFDRVPDPEDDDGDTETFARFMRATKVPPRGPGAESSLIPIPEVVLGSALFDGLQCGTCHVRTLFTAPAGTVINGGTFTVPEALGSKIIHPYSDFLLHDVGTGDGIVQNGGYSTRNKTRTAPLWGLRARNRFMHDAASYSLIAAIRRHKGEATDVTRNFERLRDAQKNQLVAFLLSL